MGGLEGKGWVEIEKESCSSALQIFMLLSTPFLSFVQPNLKLTNQHTQECNVFIASVFDIVRCLQHRAGMDSCPLALRILEHAIAPRVVVPGPFLVVVARVEKQSTSVKTA